MKMYEEVVQLHAFLTSACDGSAHALAALLPGKDLLVPAEYEAGWAPELVGTWWQREKSPLGIKTQKRSL
jgi:hypothetical protein